MRRKRSVRAAVARDVSVATEMTSDPGASLGPGSLRSRCYGNHVAGSRGARATRRACRPASDAARVCGPQSGRWPRGCPRAFHGGRAAREFGPSPQVASSTRRPPEFRGKSSGQEEGASLLVNAPKPSLASVSALATGRPLAAS